MITATTIKLVQSLHEENTIYVLDRLIGHVEDIGAPFLEELRDVVEGFKETIREELKESVKEERRMRKEYAKGIMAKPRGAKREQSAYYQFLTKEMERLRLENDKMTGVERRTEANRLWAIKKAEATAAAPPPSSDGASSSSDAAPTTPVKRGRGRPRKHAV